MNLRPALAATCALAALAGAPVAAQEAGAPAPSFGDDVPSVTDGSLSTQSRRDQRLVFTVLLGAESRPAYFGSEENQVVPSFRPNVLALNFGQIQTGDGTLDDDPLERPLGFGFGPSFRVVTERSADDHDELSGLEDIDATFELGAQVGYVWPSVEAFGQLRYGFGGSEAWVGELGAYYVTRPADNFAFRIGPRLLFGSDEYADTYFGVTPAEAAASGGSFRSFDAEGGAMTAGVELGMTYEIDENWGLDGAVVYEQFVGSAADSPIVEQGSDEQVSIRLGVTRNISFGF